MKLIIAISAVILLSLVACSRTTLEEELQVHIDTFERHCQIEVDIPIEFKDTLPREGEVGNCGKNNKVSLLRSFWIRISKTNKEVLVLHELGHCILNKGHKKGTIMQGELLHENKYLPWRRELIEELCNED